MVGSITSTKVKYGYNIDVVLEASETFESIIDAGVNKHTSKLSFVISDYSGSGDITIKIYFRAEGGSWFEDTAFRITETTNETSIIAMFVNEIKIECIAAATNAAKIKINLII